MHDHQHAVFGLLHVQLNEVCAGVYGIRESVEGVFRRMGGKSSVRRHRRLLEQGELEGGAVCHQTVDKGEVQHQRSCGTADGGDEDRAPAERRGSLSGGRLRLRKRHVRTLRPPFLQQRHEMRHADGRGEERERPQHQLHQQLQHLQRTGGNEAAAVDDVHRQQCQQEDDRQQRQQYAEIA